MVLKAIVGMQRLSTTNAVTVDHWTVFMLIMETQVSKLTAISFVYNGKTNNLGIL